MKKILKFGLISLLFTLLLTLLLPVRIKAESREAYYVFTSPGADMATEINISWHSDVEGTLVEYTPVSDVNWNNALRVTAECEPFSMPAEFWERGKIFRTIGFDERNRCTVSLTGLTPDTEYKYRVGKTGFGETYYFKTGSNIEPFSFLFFTDPQFFSDSTAKIFNDLVYKALETDPDIRLSVIGGDIVDRAGDINYWNWLFNQPCLREMPFAFAYGNHDYYEASSPNIYSNAFTNAFTNFPDNGTPGVKGSTYYFKYNNVLFVVLDSEAVYIDSSLRQAQMDWFEEVMKTNHAQYITVYFHEGYYFPTNTSTDKARWLNLFDKYGVDLVMTGHGHVYTRTRPIYNNQPSTDPNKGTIYIEGGYSGPKAGSIGSVNSQWYEKGFATEATVSIFQVTGSHLYLRTINKNGHFLDEATLPAKRSVAAASGFEKESYLDSVTVTLDKKDPTKALFYWGNKWYGHVNAAQLIDTEENIFGYDYLYTNKLGNYLEIPNIEPNKLYNYTLKVDFKDGTKAERPLTLSTKLPYGQIDNLYLDDSSKDLTLNWFALLINDQVDKYWVYINDELYKEVASDATSVALSGLSPYRHNEITLKAADIYGDIVYTGTVEYGEELPITISYPQDEIELTVGASESPNIEIDPEKDITIIYASSDESVVTVSADGKITAVGVGEATVTAKVREREEATASIKVKVVAASEPKKEEPKKKGCFSSATLLVSLSYLGLILIIRRRRLI